jgi:hypothetical protein
MNSNIQKENEFSQSLQKVNCYLEKMYNQFIESNGTTVGDLKTFFVNLNKFRENLGIDRWSKLVSDIQQNKQDIMELFSLDPFTKRCITQPRGYAGDAVMMDMIYDTNYVHYERDTKIQDFGKMLFDVIINNTDYPQAVRDRKKEIGSEIDKIYKKKNSNKKLNILSVASGHCRELTESTEFLNGNVNVFALDQDELSLNVIENDYKKKGYDVQVIECSITKLFKKQNCENILSLNNGEEFDFIWSAGLYDYLKLSTCQALTKSLFSMVKPGGQLMLANFLNNNDVTEQPGPGYLELFMNWALDYKSIDEIRKFSDSIDPQNIESKYVYAQNVMGFTNITKKSLI